MIKAMKADGESGNGNEASLFDLRSALASADEPPRSSANRAAALEIIGGIWAPSEKRKLRIFGFDAEPGSASGRGSPAASAACRPDQASGPRSVCLLTGSVVNAFSQRIDPERRQGFWPLVDRLAQAGPEPAEIVARAYQISDWILREELATALDGVLSPSLVGDLRRLGPIFSSKAIDSGNQQTGNELKLYRKINRDDEALEVRLSGDAEAGWRLRASAAVGRRESACAYLRKEVVSRLGSRPGSGSGQFDSKATVVHAAIVAVENAAVSLSLYPADPSREETAFLVAIQRTAESAGVALARMVQIAETKETGSGVELVERSVSFLDRLLSRVAPNRVAPLSRATTDARPETRAELRSELVSE